MFWSLDHCLGRQIYTQAVHMAWVKIFSSMLRVIVPVAVAHELASNEAQKKRVMDHEGAFGYKQSDGSKRENETAASICPVIPRYSNYNIINLCCTYLSLHAATID